MSRDGIYLVQQPFHHASKTKIQDKLLAYNYLTGHKRKGREMVRNEKQGEFVTIP